MSTDVKVVSATDFVDNREKNLGAKGFSNLGTLQAADGSTQLAYYDKTGDHVVVTAAAGAAVVPKPI